MKIRDLLLRKGPDVITAAPEETVSQAIQRLVENRIGALLVVEGTRIAGIISERDILREARMHAQRLGERHVREAMTRDVVTGNPDVEVHEAMAIMTHRRIRHLPIVEDGELRGMISIGDLVWSTLDEAESENQHLKEYISGGY